MDFSALPPELALHVARHMDMTTTFNFMLTNKTNHHLICSYEHSICKAKTSYSSTVASDRKILSSSHVYRDVLLPNTFAWVKEHELREQRIAEIIQSGYIDISSPPGLKPLTVTQQERFIDLLCRSLRHCDAMADIAANVPHALPEYDYTLVSSGFWTQSTHMTPEQRNRSPFSNIPARKAQIKYLKSLPVEELAALYVTITAAATGHVNDRPDIQGDPSFAERVTVFEECILRHGTWFFWAQVSQGAKRRRPSHDDMAANDDNGTQQATGTRNKRRNLTLREMTGYMMIAGFQELIDWETGADDIPKGLRMSLLDAAESRFDDDRPAVYYLYKSAREFVYDGKS